MTWEFETLFAERSAEVDVHLAAIELLSNSAVAGGPPATHLRLSSDQINILKSGFVVHLYNLVEATMAKILDEISGEVCKHLPSNLADDIRRAWLRARGGLDAQIDGEQRLTRVFELLEEFVGNTPPRRQHLIPSSNWSHVEVEQAARRLGCALNIPADVNRAACLVHFVDDEPPMLFLRNKRNKLAHGNQSFVDGVLALDIPRLRALHEPIIAYLLAVQTSFVSYLDGQAFLRIREA